MLSLTGNAAATLRIFDDRVIEAVNDIEMLATNVSRRIWHKLSVRQAAARGAMPVKAATE